MKSKCYILKAKGADIMTHANFKADDTLKAKAESACSAMGLIKVANERRIPFEVSDDPFYSSENMAELARRIADVKAGRNMHEHGLINVV